MVQGPNGQWTNFLCGPWSNQIFWCIATYYDWGRIVIFREKSKILHIANLQMMKNGLLESTRGPTLCTSLFTS